MFGYRVLFQEEFISQVPAPESTQNHKPIHRYVNDIIGELSQGYLPINRYHTRQRILIPIHEDSEEEEKENAEGKTDAAAPQQSDKEKEKESPTQRKERDKQMKEFTAGIELTTERAEKRKLSASIKMGNGELVVLKNSQGEK